MDWKPITEKSPAVNVHVWITNGKNLTRAMRIQADKRHGVSWVAKTALMGEATHWVEESEFDKEVFKTL